MLDPADTIAAVASAPGPGFRGVVRVTGPEAWAVGLAGFDREMPEPLPSRPWRVEGGYRLDGLRPVLPASVLLWPGPRTFTGQPLVEVQTVGAPPLLERLLAHFLARGARPAEPGEFTLRAFLSGRIDLTQAEAVLGVVGARNPAQLDAALAQLAGGLSGPLVALRDRLLDVLAHLEAGLDFVDEADVDPLGRAELAGSLAASASDLTALADRLNARDRPDGRPRVVLVGPPNAGKSRLFNALAGAERAIVAAVPGTTRDYLAAPADCDGLPVELVDTAGAETPRDAVEARAQALRDAEAARADLLLVCTPADAERSDPFAPDPASDRPRLFVRTKADLIPDVVDSPGVITTSAATGAGLPALRRAVAAALRDERDESDLPATTGARCRDSLRRAGDALAAAATALSLGAGDELVAVDLRLALDELGKVVGAVVTDDVLDRIFQRFCIGK